MEAHFDDRHYVPVLKVKRAEKTALRVLRSPVQAALTPLLEIIERRDKDIDLHLCAAFRDLRRSLNPYQRCFIDAREVADSGPDAARAVFQYAQTAGISFTPVTGVSRTVDVGAALTCGACGVALRVSQAELDSGDLGPTIAAFLAANDLSPQDVDLIMDLGPDLVIEGIMAMTQAFLNAVPHHQQWRTFVLSGCAFPKGMGIVERNSSLVVPRSEWTAWLTRLHSRRHELERVPTFSDCGIQHTSGVEQFDPQTMSASATIRYALTDGWLLIKGESGRNKPLPQQFPTLAQELVYGELKEHYAGQDHCYGCWGMKQAADGASGYGSAEVWRRLGTVHHITVARQGLTSLSWS